VRQGTKKKPAGALPGGPKSQRLSGHSIQRPSRPFEIFTKERILGAMVVARDLPGFEERFTDVKGVRMRYLTAGSGPAIVLVHGLGGAAANWISVAPALVRSWRVLVLELPGHGGSAPLAAAPNLSPFADRVAGVLEREGVARAAAVGHSLGASVVLRLAIRHPHLVNSVVLAGAAGISSRRRAAVYGLRLSALLQPGRRIAPYRRRIAVSPFLRALVFGGWGASDAAAMPTEAAEGFLAGPATHSDTASAVRALLLEDPREELERVTCPSLVLWGARDTQLSLADAFEYTRRLGARLRVIADCGHLLIGERPDACLDAIERFLREIGDEKQRPHQPWAGGVAGRG
jgi:pimeloyl-ACP methyl ester carboxylesterase